MNRDPLRRCQGCMEMKPKSKLFRVAKMPDGTIVFDENGKTPGRGAYLCRNKECLDRALKIRGLERSLSGKVPQDIYNRLEAELEKNE